MKSGANYSISCLKIKSISKHSFSFGLPFFFSFCVFILKLLCFLFVCLFVQFQATRNGWGFRGSRFQTIGWYAQKTFVQLLIFWFSWLFFNKFRSFSGTWRAQKSEVFGFCIKRKTDCSVFTEKHWKKEDGGLNQHSKFIDLVSL